MSASLDPRRGVLRLLRAIYKKEQIPVRVRWWLAAAGMRDWFRMLAKGLRGNLGSEKAKQLLSQYAAVMFERRYHALQHVHSLPDAAADRANGRRDIALLMSALYRVDTELGRSRGKSAFLFSELGGPPRGIRERLRAQSLLRALSPQARWEEVATHLGELLIVLTERLPDELPHARRILGDICFEAGTRYGEQMVRAFGIDKAENPPEHALEILRMSEYIFHVNPEHWGAADAATNTGWLEGTACPWYSRPGWNGGHCGIFGQFQSGISSVFGLRYHLSTTIPKHGGTTCRIDLKPIPLGKKLR